MRQLTCFVASVVLLLGAGAAASRAQSPPGYPANYAPYAYTPEAATAYAAWPGAAPAAPFRNEFGDPGCATPWAGEAGVGGPGAVEAAAWQPGFQAWPNISPYDYRFSQHYEKDGLWNWEHTNERDRYYFDVDGLIWKLRPPGEALVGAEGFTPVIRPISGTAQFVTNDFFSPVKTGVLRRGFGSDIGDQLDVNERRGEKEPVEGGLRLTWGMREPDQTGFSGSGWFATKSEWHYSRGLPGNENDLTSLRVTHSLPLNTGSGVETVLYDKLFKIEFSSQGAGADAAWYMTPRWRGDTFHIQPAFGVRFLYINEEFRFFGADSGANYTVLIPPGTVIANTFVPGIPYQTEIESGVSSHLVGPEIGMHWTVGGDSFRIVGDSRVGLAANFERLRLRGNGVGNGFDLDFVQDSPFSLREEHGHVSPMTAHSVQAEMNLLGILPVFRNMSLFEHAKLRAGYSVIFAGEIARPHRIIEYLGQPLTPQITNRERSRWNTHGYNVGFHWEY